MNRRTLALALTTLLATTPACLFSMDPNNGQENNENNSNNENNTNNATNNANNTNNTSVTGGSNNPTNNSNNQLGSACDLETDELPCGGEYVCCGGTCVDTDEDPFNCGSCGFECGEGQECFQGMCAQEDEGGCEPAETLLSTMTEDVTAFPRPLLVPVDDPNYACVPVDVTPQGTPIFGEACPLGLDYVYPPIEDASYIAFYGTAPTPDASANTINVALVNERGELFENSRGTITNPGHDLVEMRATSTQNSAQVVALWREAGVGSEMTLNGELVIYDLLVPSKQAPGITFGSTSEPIVTLADNERIASFDVIQVPLGESDPNDLLTDLRAIIFGVVSDKTTPSSGSSFKLYFTVIGRSVDTRALVLVDEFTFQTDPVDIDARAGFSNVQLALGESATGVDDAGMPTGFQESVFVVVSAGKLNPDLAGRRIFLYNNFLLPTDEEFEEGDLGPVVPVYPEFKVFGDSWTPQPARNPSDSYMPVTLLQGDSGRPIVSALTTSSNPANLGSTSTLDITELVAIDGAQDHIASVSPPAQSNPFSALARPLYTFSAQVVIAPWFPVPGLLGWMEGKVSGGLVDSTRSLRYAPVLFQGSDGTSLGSQDQIVREEEMDWVEAYDAAVGSRSYGILTVTKVGQNGPSEAQFRAISSDGRPICTLAE